MKKLPFKTPNLTFTVFGIINMPLNSGGSMWKHLYLHIFRVVATGNYSGCIRIWMVIPFNIYVYSLINDNPAFLTHPYDMHISYRWLSKSFMRDNNSVTCHIWMSYLVIGKQQPLHQTMELISHPYDTATICLYHKDELVGHPYEMATIIMWIS